MKNELNTTLPAPKRPPNLPNDAQWLAGEGAGSWFHLSIDQGGFIINRYSDKGKLECSGKFQLVKEKGFSEKKPFEFIHLSHCQSVRIRQGGKVFKFERISGKYSQLDRANQ